MNDRPLSTVGALIVASDGEILLVQSKKWLDCFSTPGGKIECGETKVEALNREIWEETGLKINNPRFALTQDCIFSPQFWKKKHFVMHDYIVSLDPSYSKDQVRLNDEAYAYLWIEPNAALKLPLIVQCRNLVIWYLSKGRLSQKMIGIIGVEGHCIECIVGIYSQERLIKQTLIVDIKLKYDLTQCQQSGDMKDSINYVEVAQLCTDLAQTQHYELIETFAFEVLENCLKKFQALWVWVKIKKPAAIPTASYAFVECERYREGD